MQFSVTFRHMEASDAIREYAREKVERIKKYFPDPIMAHVVFATERGYQHHADVNIQLHNGLLIKGTEITEDMYSSIDLVMAKIERQCRRYKEKIHGHKARATISSIPIAHHVLSDQPAPEAVTDGGSQKSSVLHTEHIEARTLSVDEALMQLNLANHAFLVFHNSKSGTINVVYKREDGHYGLIETGGQGVPAGTSH